jgi:hypothetical protein
MSCGEEGRGYEYGKLYIAGDVVNAKNARGNNVVAMGRRV